jgi:O-antigen ligase
MLLGIFFLYFNDLKKGIFTSNKYFLLKFRLNKAVNRNQVMLFVMVVVLMLGLLLPVFVPGSTLKEIPSFYRRSNLLTSSFSLIKENFILGVGFSESTKYIEKYMPRSPDIRFVQPVHNIFILLFVEVGVLALLSFGYLMYLLIKVSSGLPVLFMIWLMHIMLLGSFDHYFITMPQTLVFLFIIFGMINSLDKKRIGVLDKELIV